MKNNNAILQRIRNISLSQAKYIGLITFSCLTVSIFCFSLIKHISYPLLWNDEAYGAAFAERIISYGYPKVHDEKGNIIFELPKTYSKSINKFYNKDLDISTYIPWGNEYFSVIGVFLSNCTNDIYKKTALVRIPFAITSIIGLFLFLVFIRPFFPKNNHFILIVAIFFLLETLSVHFVLHMREARYYSIMVFLQACFFGIWLNGFILNKIKPKTQYFLLIILNILTYHINFPLMYIFFATWISYIGFNLFIKKDLKFGLPDGERFKNSCLALIPLIISVIVILPFELLIYKTYQVTASLTKSNTFFSLTYWEHLLDIIHYFLNYEWLIAGSFIKIVFWGLWFFKPYREGVGDLYSKFFRASIFLNSLFFIAIMAVSKSFIQFSRYFMPFQPVLIISIILEGYFVFRWLYVANISKFIKTMFILTVITFCLTNFVAQLPWIKGRIYELSHQYKGPLDYIIPYIKDNYREPENLVIATDYETTSYMFYLKSRVIIGYIPFQLEQDMKYTPDILIYRKWWHQSYEPFNNYLKKAKYKKIDFPVLDLPVNSIPELYYPSFRHHFKTRLSKDSDYQAYIWIKVSE